MNQQNSIHEHEQQSIQNERLEAQQLKKNQPILEKQQTQQVEVVNLDDFQRAKLQIINFQLDAGYLVQAQLNCKDPTFKYYKQGFYYGDFLNGEKHGFGVILNISEKKQSLFAGQWVAGKRNGNGKEFFSNGDQFEGMFVNNRPEGQGTYIASNGETYVGSFFNGLRHGYGVFKGLNDLSYKGEWFEGQASGIGKLKQKNASYEGEVRQFLRHGRGVEHFSNGDYYDGQYVNGFPDGYGIYLWNNGSFYKGQFSGGLRNGKGYWQKQSNEDGLYDSYEGQYVNDRKCGQGIFKWASGGEYDGEFFDDFRHGYGVMKWPDGSVYKGYWSQGIKTEIQKTGQRPQSQQRTKKETLLNLFPQYHIEPIYNNVSPISNPRPSSRYFSSDRPYSLNTKRTILHKNQTKSEYSVQSETPSDLSLDQLKGRVSPIKKNTSPQLPKKSVSTVTKKTIQTSATNTGIKQQPKNQVKRIIIHSNHFTNRNHPNLNTTTCIKQNNHTTNKIKVNVIVPDFNETN